MHETWRPRVLNHRSGGVGRSTLTTGWIAGYVQFFQHTYYGGWYVVVVSGHIFY